MPFGRGGRSQRGHACALFRESKEKEFREKKGKKDSKAAAWMSAEDGVKEVSRTGFIGAHKHPGIFALRWTAYTSAYVSIR